MHLIFCVDNNYGLSFCGRRISRDEEVYAHILRLTDGHALWTSPNSCDLFPSSSVLTDISFLVKASRGDYCFLERPIAAGSVPDLESVILYHWNRRYPSTEKLSKKLLDGMRLSYTETFMGKSHDKITMERYTL